MEYRKMQKEKNNRKINLKSKNCHRFYFERAHNTDDKREGKKLTQHKKTKML